MEATFAQKVKSTAMEQRSISRASEVRARQQCLPARRRMSARTPSYITPGRLLNLWANGPPMVAAGHRPVHDLQPHLDVSAGGGGIGAYLGRFLPPAPAVPAAAPGGPERGC